MIALYLLAAHMVGDFVLQTRWQAAGKLVDGRLRARHVLTYLLPFVVVLAALRPGWDHAVAFLAALGTLHELTDSRRFRSTLGDVIAWRYVRPKGEPLEPNPWEPLPILLDQTLHVAQLALLAGLFLS